MLYWRKYFQRAYASFQEFSVYRLNTVFNIANSLLYLVMFYAIWSAIDQQGSIRGGLNQVMSYYVVSQFIWNGVVSMGPENYIGKSIRKGRIVNQLKRPMSLRADAYFREVGGSFFKILSRSFPVLAIGTAVFGMSVPSPVNALAFAVAVPLSFQLVFMFAYLIAAITFWSKVSWSLQMMRVLLVNLLAGALFPIYLMPQFAQDILNLLPFQPMIDGPINVYLMRTTGTDILLLFGKQLFWIAVLYVLSRYLWKKALKKLTVQGG
ncbi:MAG: ABC transporter permease [Candidatus Nanosalina sp.]